MNYGRYFRLNQALSKVEDGVAIYDYIDLPAYFGPSVDNPMSPKFPISVLITNDSVCVRLHYSAFKIEKQKEKDALVEREERPRYAYTEDDINQKAFIGEGSKSLMSMAHMEEVILELPFIENNSNSLSNTIKGIYNTKFPQIVDKNKSTGGRYLEQLIRKRYPPQKEWERIEKECRENESVDIETQLYKNLRDIYDNGSSYSSLWLMDLYKGGRIELFTTQAIRDKDTGEDKETDVVTGFLRKVLLDFMFDLKHSNVFQNSAGYQKMYSGLMSDFYFSSLIHKCEYYYYRKLIDKADKSGKLASLDQDGRKRVLKLYVEELAKAEDLWIQDIMNTKSDMLFEYEKKFELSSKLSQWWKEVKGGFRSHQSWFAKPEEEMQRICFTLKDDEGNHHICNTDTLIEYLKAHRNENKEVDDIISFRRRSRIAISKWFLKRYDFNDLVHLHLFVFSNLLYVSISITILLCLLLFPQSINLLKELTENLPKRIEGISIPSSGWCPIVLIFGIILAFIILKKEFIIGKFKDYWQPKNIYGARKRKVYKRVSFWIGIQLFAVLLFIVGIYINKWVAIGMFVALIFSIIKYLVPNLHLLYPRLVASIATAWLTLAASNDLYAAFFDAKLSPLVICGLLLVVFLFVLYEIDRLIPLESIIKKIQRSAELAIISYTISLIIGAFIINFTCERILERSDVMKDFYKDYVINKTEIKVENDTYKIKSGLTKQQINSLSNDNKRVAYLDSLKVDGKYPIASRIEINGYTFFILRNFWIQFSFVAMFIGIFIQMIFEDKRITEL